MLNTHKYPCRQFETIERISGFRFEDFSKIRLYESKLYDYKNYMSRNYMYKNYMSQNNMSIKII